MQPAAQLGLAHANSKCCSISGLLVIKSQPDQSHCLLCCSRERVRLSDELQRAEQQVQRSRDIIREALRFCDEAEAHRCIPEAQYDEEGELDNEAIFCAR